MLLGGSRARGDHTPESDVDLGVYYRHDPDVAALGALARELGGPDAEVTEPGGWGPWVDGGGWLRIDGVAVDWIYRDLDRVHTAWADAQAGRYAFHTQVGHPLGFLDVAYVGEVGLGVVLADPTGELAALRRAAATVPRPLADALVQRLWEAWFLVAGARKAARRADATYVAGCLFRVLGLCALALHARAGRWVVNEKGAVTAAGRLPVAPSGFGERAHRLLAALGTTPGELATTLDAAEALVVEVETACA
ncbi:nucleotidyltransferase family protein [Pseudonocardia sp. GCM10023141]|uniref:nucleotidyltransferase family protein n=1 Tax=Pseudonocardia sp. GCM10023141 TaxID=3252653 RepID=UPI00361876AB